MEKREVLEGEVLTGREPVKSSSFKKVSAVVAAGAVVSTNAMAAVTYDAATFSFSGALETAPFTSAVIVSLTLTGLVVAVRSGIRAIRSAG